MADEQPGRLLAFTLVEAAQSGDTPAMAELTGGTWESENVSSPDHQLVPGSTIVLTFSADSISIHAGCNTMNGGASIRGSALVVTSLASTMMGCDTALARQDQWVQEFMTSRPTIVLLDPDHLRLAGGGTTIRFAHHQ